MEYLLEVVMERSSDGKIDVFEIGVGQLPVVHIGTDWIDGKCQKLQKNKAAEEKLDVTISDQTVKTISTTHKDTKYYVIPPDQYRIGKNNGLSLKCHCVTNNDYRYGIIIPAIEVIRFYYSLSSRLARVLFNGTFVHNLRELYIPEKSILHSNGECDLMRGKYFSDADGWILARIAFDGNATDGARQIYYSSQKQHSPNLREPVPPLLAPFERRQHQSRPASPLQDLPTMRRRSIYRRGYLPPSRGGAL